MDYFLCCDSQRVRLLNQSCLNQNYKIKHFLTLDGDCQITFHGISVYYANYNK